MEPDTGHAEIDMRSFPEIAFRLRQELLNAWLYYFPPETSISSPPPLPGLPDLSGAAELIRGTAYERQLIALADRIVAHRFPLLGVEVSTGPDIAWRRDYTSSVESSLRYFRFVPYMDVAQVGNQKMVWELNRHQHLTLLAQAWLITGEKRYLDAALRDLNDWWIQNPFQEGMNWTAALEVAFRALSWIWLFHLAGKRMEENFQCRFLTELCLHGHHLEWNLSVYSSPNTHLLGEGVALHALGALFPQFPRAARWKLLGAEMVQGHMATHVREDGSYFEQSSYYHVYALDLFLFHALIEPVPASYRQKLERMARFVAALQGYSRLLPFLGDDDGGRIFHPYGERNQFGRASVATVSLLLDAGDLGYCAEDRYEQALWWLGPDKLKKAPACREAAQQSCRFSDTGIVILTASDLQVIIDAGPFGTGTAGHSHSDALSVLVRKGDKEILVDAGTYAYLSDPQARNWFRGTAAHNTIRIDGREQAAHGGLFRWTDPPQVEITEWAADGYLDAVVHYAGFTHRRRVALLGQALLLFVLDEVSAAAPGEHVVEQFWHWGEPGCARLFSSRPDLMTNETGGEHGWRSTAFATRQPAQVSRLSYRGVLPMAFGTVLDCSGREATVELLEQTGGWSMRLVADRRWEILFLPQGLKIVESQG